MKNLTFLPLLLLILVISSCTEDEIIIDTKSPDLVFLFNGEKVNEINTDDPYLNWEVVDTNAIVDIEMEFIDDVSITNAEYSVQINDGDEYFRSIKSLKNGNFVNFKQDWFQIHTYQWNFKKDGEWVTYHVKAGDRVVFSTFAEDSSGNKAKFEFILVFR